MVDTSKGNEGGESQEARELEIIVALDHIRDTVTDPRAFVARVNHRCPPHSPNQ